MPADPKQYDSALISSDNADHWPAFVNTASTLRQEVNNIPNPDDRVRHLAYRLWTDMYRNRPEHFKVIIRGEEEDSVEVYLPSARKYIEATNRFLCVGFELTVDEEVGTANDQKAVTDQIEKLFKRERFEAKFANQRRWGLVKGDAIWHLVGDPSKRPGEKICLRMLPPETYFPIEDVANDRVLGCHIVDIIRNPKNSIATRASNETYFCRRQTYRRIVDQKNNPIVGEGAGVTSELALFELAKWDDRDSENEIKLVEQLIEPFMLPAPIDQLPIYHWRNDAPFNSRFGISEIAGIETLIKAMNQSLSDEDLTLITQGLGVFYTDAAPPVDEAGNPVPWDIGPGKVVQTGPQGNFNRVSAVSSVAPYQEHMKYMDDGAEGGIGVPDLATGQVPDVQAVESGIARILKMGPMIAKNAEKEIEILGVHDQFAYDLIHKWFPAYEGAPTYLDAEGNELVSVTAITDDPMPQDRKAIMDEALQLFGLGIWPVDKFYTFLNEWGYDFEDGDFEQALADQTMLQEALSGGGGGFGGDGTQPTDAQGNPVDAQGNPIPPDQQQQQNGNGNAPPDALGALSTAQLANLVTQNGSSGN